MDQDNVLIGKMQKIMELRAKGYSVNFDFPSIAVIGSQSSGKSSVVENIVGRHLLPRGTNMVTRCPIVLNLRHETVLEREFAQFAPTNSDPNPEIIEDFSTVREMIEERTNRITESRFGVTEECIVLNVHSSHYPDNLQLIDLPGFVRNAVAGQPDDIREQIERLVHKFIKNENSIILAVSDAMVDMAESAGIAEARKVDPDGIRTVGVLTKVDILPKEKVNDVVDTLNNKLLPLSKGYVAVINSPAATQGAAEESITSHRSKEIELFNKSSLAHRIRNFGTSFLQKKLSQELTNKIREKIPSLVAIVTDELESVKSELSGLNYREDAQGTSNTKRVIEKIKIYESSVIIMLQGNDRRVSSTEIQGGALLKNMLKQDMEKARKEAMSLNPIDFGKEIEIMLYNLDASNDSILPSSLAFINCVAVLVEKFKKPFSQLINNFTEELTSHIRKCADEALGTVPNLKQKIIDMTTEKVLEFRESCKADMNRHIDIQKHFINTGHPEFKTYHNLINGIKNGDVEELNAAPTSPAATTPGNLSSQTFIFDDDSMDKNIKWIKERVNTFCQFQSGEVSSDSDSKLSVPISQKSRKDFFLEIVLAYMLILETSLCHTGLKLVTYHLVHNVVEFHESHDLYEKVLELNANKIEEYLKIDPYKQERLDTLVQQEESCKEVLKILRDSN